MFPLKNVLWLRKEKKKKPWSKFFKIQKLFYRPRNKLYSNLDFPKWNESELAELKAEHRESDDILNEHQNELQKELDYIKGKNH